jgi:hypothetical protein
MPPLRPTIAEREAAEAINFEAITALRLKLHDNGHPPVPVTGPDADVNSPGKAPRMSGWQEKCPKATAQDIMSWPKLYPDCPNTGISCDRSIGVDIDISDPDISAERVKRAQEVIGPTRLIRIGKAPKALLVYRLEASVDKFSTTELWFGDDIDNKEMKVQIEFLGCSKQQFVGFGEHPDTRESYYWPDKSLLDVSVEDVPLTTVERLLSFKIETENVLRAAGARDREQIQAEIREREDRGFEAAGMRRHEKPTYAKVEDALHHFPNDVDRLTYIKVGYAIYHGLGEAGWSLFESWAKQHFSYDAKHTTSDWRSFRKGRSTTVGTLFWLAGLNGWKSNDRSSSSGKTRYEDSTTAQSEPEAPRPLMREISPPEPFPIAALGDILGPAAIGIQDKVQAPMELCAQSALAATALTVQAFADIQLPDQNRRPISCYFFSVASTGERKSATDDIALLPVIRTAGPSTCEL